MQMAAPRPLRRLRVTELGDFMSAPYAGRLLADLGAAVIKVEQPEHGDSSRAYGPFPDGAEPSEHSGLFAYLNTNKRGITLDVRSAAGQETLDRLLQQSDVLLLDESFLKQAPELLDSRRLVSTYPHLIVEAITPFGASGPYRDYAAYDITCSAAAGMSFGVGEPGREPLPLPLYQCLMQGGISGAIAVLIAWLARAQTGRGQHIDISIHEVMSSLFTGFYLPRYIYGGGVPGRRNGRIGESSPYAHTVLPCKDGHVLLITPQIAQWIRFIHLLGDPDWAKQPRYRDRRAMQWQYKDEVDQLLLPWLKERTKSELLQLFVEHRIPYAPLMTARDLVANDHLNSRGAIEEYTFSGGGTFIAPASPYRFNHHPIRHARAPVLGEHNEQVLAELGANAERSQSLREEQASQEMPPSPLSRFRVLDFGTAWAGGMAGRMLADFGADVIKVESWTYMDGARKGTPIIVDDTSGGDEGKWPDLQPGFHVLGRNKRSIAINLRVEGGLDLLSRLIRKSDAIIHNFAPGVMERLGLGYERLRELNPKLVLAGQSAAGSEGPLKAYIGYAGTISALAGMAGLIGYAGEPPIGVFQGLYCDIVSAMTTVFAVLAGVVEAQQSGEGQEIDISQWEATLALLPELLMSYSIEGREMGPTGAYHRLCCPYGNYPSAGDDEWVSIATGSEEEWERLCAALGTPELARDPRFDTLERRQENRAALDQVIGAWTRDRSACDATDTLQAARVAAFQVCNVESVYFDEHLKARNAFVDLSHPLVGTEPLPGIPWKLSATPGSSRTPAPLLGQHNEEVLLQLMDVTPEEYRSLVERGIVEEAKVKVTQA